MPSIRRELPPPDPVANSQKAIEVLRAWQCDGVLHLTMPDRLPANLVGCALLVADIVRIIARAEHLHPGQTAVAAVQELKHYIFGFLRPEPQEVPRDAPHLVTYHEFIQLFHAETDRAAAVLAGSYVESYLGDCLRYSLINHESTDKLFKNAGPLETFAARVNLAFALGLMTERMKSNFRFIIKIRNHFAHHPAETSFTVSPVRDWCSQLSRVAELADRTPRELYLFAVSEAVLQLNNAMLSVFPSRHLAESDASY